jgi:hypothetical protein
MHFDARDLDSKELFLRLRDILASNRGSEVDLEIKIRSAGETQRVKAFVSMSGCRSEIEKTEECYIMRISGSPCCT